MDLYDIAIADMGGKSAKPCGRRKMELGFQFSHTIIRSLHKCVFPQAQEDYPSLSALQRLPVIKPRICSRGSMIQQ
jgi:hypothetical protein